VTISAKILAHSAHDSDHGYEVFTILARYPRFIHAEELTHRVMTPEEVVQKISDGVMYASPGRIQQRAIPVERLIQDVLSDTAMPIHWGKNQPGMQANEECFNPIAATAARRCVGTFWWERCALG
jgi:hypothetical protein